MKKQLECKTHEVGTEVVERVKACPRRGFIINVDDPALGPEFGQPRYTVQWVDLSSKIIDESVCEDHQIKRFVYPSAGRPYWYQDQKCSSGEKQAETKREPECKTNGRGDKVWTLDGEYHREDGPAFEGVNGDVIYYAHGKIHREGAPAWIRANGDKSWYRHGKCHRVGAPAFVTGCGHKEYWFNGKNHREDGGPAIITPNGTKKWMFLGKNHRVGGPAIEYPSGWKEWWICNMRHRVDGPAVIYADGTKEWWLCDERLSEEGHRILTTGTEAKNFILKGEE